MGFSLEIATPDTLSQAELAVIVAREWASRLRLQQRNTRSRSPRRSGRQGVGFSLEIATHPEMMQIVEESLGRQGVGFSLEIATVESIQADLEEDEVAREWASRLRLQLSATNLGAIPALSPGSGLLA